MAASDVAGFLAEAGQVVAGGAALVGALGFVVATVARDLGYPADPIGWAERGAQFGALIGIGTLLGRL
jgi:hypothetical protein